MIAGARQSGPGQCGRTCPVIAHGRESYNCLTPTLTVSTVNESGMWITADSLATFWPHRTLPHITSLYGVLPCPRDSAQKCVWVHGCTVGSGRADGRGARADGFKVLDVERRPAAGTRGRGKRWVHVLWQGVDEKTGEPWGSEWVWGGLLNDGAAAEAREMERQRDEARRRAREVAALQRASSRRSEFDQVRAAEQGSRQRPATEAVEVRRSRRQRSQPAERTEPQAWDNERSQAWDNEQWRPRRRVPCAILEVRGRWAAKKVIVRWRYADASGQGGAMWVQIAQLPAWMRMMARSRWERGRRVGETRDAPPKRERGGGGDTNMDVSAASGDAAATSGRKRRARELGARRRGEGRRYRRLQGQEARGDRADDRLRHAGYEWLLDGAAEYEMRAPKRRADENERGSGSREMRARGLQSPSLLRRQGDG